MTDAVKGPGWEQQEPLESQEKFYFVVVFECEHKGKMTAFATENIRKLQRAGLALRVFFSVQQDEVYVEIGAPLERLRLCAEQVGKRLPLNPEIAQQLAEAGSDGIAPIHINDDAGISSLKPYHYIFGHYLRSAEDRQLYVNAPHIQHPFTASVRLQLLWDIIKSPVRLGGADIALETLVLDKKILAFFLKHEPAKKADLKDRMLVVLQVPWNAPVHHIKQYFGEKIALYFEFMAHLQTWLLPLGIVGLAVYIVTMVLDDIQHPIAIAFSLLVVIWGIFVLETWKRKEKFLALKSGMLNYEKEQQDRPEFKGTITNSPIDGRPIKWFSSHTYRNRIRATTSLVATLITCVLGCLTGIYALKYYLVYLSDRDWGRRYGATIASVINALQIQILNALYRRVALKLTEYENHRTETEFQDYLIVKLFAFQFVNTFGAFFWLAFISEGVAGIKCENEDGCLGNVSHNLAIIYISHLVVGNALELGTAWLKHRSNKFKETRSAEGVQLSYAEKEYMLANYNATFGLIKDMSEQALQFAFCTLFVVTFPLAPLCGFISIYVEVRIDGYKLLSIQQRPVPRGAQDIGMWQHVLTFISVASVITNCALICFVFDTGFGSFPMEWKLGSFILLLCGVFTLYFLVRALVPDIPTEVAIQLKRQDFLVSKLIDRVPDTGKAAFDAIDDSKLPPIPLQSTPLSPHSSSSSSKGTAAGLTKRHKPSAHDDSSNHVV